MTNYEAIGGCYSPRLNTLLDLYYFLYRFKPYSVTAAILDKTTWESFPIMSTFPRNKTISKRRLCGKKTPSPNSMLLPTNAQGSGFLLNTQQHCFQGKGERKEPVLLRCLEKYFPSMQFSQHFCPRLYFLFLITSCTFSDCCFPCIPLACWLFSKHMWLVLGSSTLSGHPVLDPNLFPGFAWIYSVCYSRYWLL